MSAKIKISGLLEKLSYGSFNIAPYFDITNNLNVEKIDQVLLSAGDNNFVCPPNCIGVIIIFDDNVLGFKVLRTTGLASTGLQLQKQHAINLIMLPVVGGITLILNSSNTDLIGYTTVIYF